MTSWMKKLISCGSCLLVPLGLVAADANQDAILRRIDELQRQVVEQQAAIQALKSQIDENQAQIDEAMVTRGLAAEGGAPLTLGENIDGLTILGDLRLRYEYSKIDYDSDMSSSTDETQNTRFRTRFRLGFLWKNSTESWEIGAGLITGQAEECSDFYGASDGRSGNASWNTGSPWQSSDIFLDYAYAKHTWDAFSLTLGQQKNPFVASWIMFDTDLRPTGATVQYDSDMFFVTMGAYNLLSDTSTGYGNGNHQSLANLYAAQLGLKLEMEPVQALLAIGYWHYDSETVEYALSNMAMDQDYRYEIGSIYAEINATVAEMKLKLFGEYAMNFGVDSGDSNNVSQTPLGGMSFYDAEDNDQAWIIGVQVKAFGFTAEYAYASIEGDAIPYFVSDSEFGSLLTNSPGYSRNVQGHVLGLGYDLTKNCTLSATAMLTEYVETWDGWDNDASLYQIDLTYKF